MISYRSASTHIGIGVEEWRILPFASLLDIRKIRTFPSFCDLIVVIIYTSLLLCGKATLLTA
nr:MAG TPA: hypothetical protein [Caudoviricetes sp.]